MASNVINIKLTKFDNTPWGFRLAGGSDFPQPLTVIRVTEGSLAECMGLKVGDVVVRLNDQSISSLTHGQAHEELMRAGNNFVLAVQREGDPLKALEALSEDNIVPYKIPLADLPPVFPEQILKEDTAIEEPKSEEPKPSEEGEAKPEVEPLVLPDKPKDANSEIVPNQNLTDDEIAQLILEEEELLDDKGVLGVNFKKLRPRVTALKQSKVIEELQNLATAEPPLVEQLKRTSVFLQKPQRPIPTPRKKQEEEQTEVESYRVVIKKQKKRSFTDRLLEKGLLKPEGSTPEPPTPEVNMENNKTGLKIGNEKGCFSTPTDDNDRYNFCSQKSYDENQSSDHSHDTADSPILKESSDDNPCSATCSPSVESSPEIRQTLSSLNVEFPPGVAPLQLLKRRKNTAASKRRFDNRCTRAHYFRRCLFGKRSYREGDVKKPVKARSSFRGRFQGSDSSTEDSQEHPRPRRFSEAGTSRTKGRYLETYLSAKRENYWMSRVLDGLFENPDNFSSSKTFDRLFSRKQIPLRRTLYAEKILVRSVRFVADRLRSDILSLFEDRELTDILVESKSRINKRFHFKGRYFQRIFWRNVVRLISCVKGIASSKNVRTKNRRRSSIIKMRGRYVEKYLLERTFFDFRDLSVRRFSARPSFGIGVVSSKKRRFFARARYVERILKRHFESLGLIIGYVRCQFLQSIFDSSAVIPACSSLNSCVILPAREDSFKQDVLSDLIRSSKDFISTQVFHRGSRKLSRSFGGSASSSNRSNTWVSYLFDWFSPKTRFVGDTISEGKLDEDNERNRRRLSFVPTILYKGLTNRIGVDFTRLVAYAFVPFTSLILLYMYK